jgi:molybdate transport system substrate-binding protein
MVLSRNNIVQASILILAITALWIPYKLIFDNNSTDNELLVLAAASLTDACNELALEYNFLNPDIHLIFSFASSGTLKSQIREGAPADIFLSASKKHMKDLIKEKLILNGTEIDLICNKIVLVTPSGNPGKIRSIRDLRSDKTLQFAMGDPESVPAGEYARKILSSSGLWDSLKSEAIYASDVRQVLAWAEAGEIDCGFVYSSDAKISDKVEIFELKEGFLQSSIIYPAAVINTSLKIRESENFLHYLTTENAKRIFTKYGFLELEI